MSAELSIENAPLRDLVRDSRLSDVPLWMMERYFKTRAECFREFSETMEARLGIKHDPYSEQFVSGMLRPGDAELAIEILKRVANRPDSRPLKCLEAGCGFTLGSNYNYGSPWFSRVLQKSFPGILDITVTDLADDLVAFDLEKNSLVYRYRINREEAFEIEPSALIRSESGLIYERQKIRENRLYFRGSEKIVEAAVLHTLDPEVEDSFFGLKARGGVSFYAVKEAFPDETFDIVYGRYLHGFSTEMFKNSKEVQDSLKTVISPGGFGWTYFSQKEHVCPRCFSGIPLSTEAEIDRWTALEKKTRLEFWQCLD